LDGALDPFDCQGDRVATAEAEGSDSSGFSIALHGMEQRDEDACAAGAYGMPDGDRSAVDIDPRWIEFQFAIDRECLDAKSFVQFKEVDTRKRPSRFRSDSTHGIDGREAEPFGLAAAGGLGADDGHWLEAQFPRPLGAHDDHGGGAIADAREHCPQSPCRLL
jgi:hypothetical protein